MDEVFEKIYQKYYVSLISAILAKVSEGKEVLPDVPTQEKIIEDALGTECAFRFIVVLPDSGNKPLKPGDRLYPFGWQMTNKDFFKLIHKDFLVPYLLYARFAYELAREIKATRQELMQMNYQICLPIKWPGKKEYCWYTQKSRILTLNEHNQVISHINFYNFWGEFIEIAGKHEKMFIRATILRDHAVSERFQTFLREQMTAYFKDDVFKPHLWEEIKARASADPKKSRYQNKKSMYSVYKKIKSLHEEHTGYSLQDIDEVVAYLQRIGAL